MLFPNIIGCKKDRADGDGNTQGTCPQAHQKCNPDGTCSGKYFFIY